eukprot:5233701-Amphidinium_carterae.1
MDLRPVLRPAACRKSNAAALAGKQHILEYEDVFFQPYYYQLSGCWSVFGSLFGDTTVVTTVVNPFNAAGPLPGA